MAGMHFDATYNSEPVTKALDKIQKGIYETAKAAELAGGRIDAAFNSVSFGDTLKKQIYEGSQSINGLTAQIIKQKGVIKDVEQDVRNLGEAYRRAGAGTSKGNALFADFKSAKSALQEEKSALFDLQTQQAQARLSVRKLKDEYSLYQKEGQNVVDSNNNMALSFKKTLAAIGGTAMIQKFVSDVVRVRGQFQQLDVAFTTLLQSKEKANALMSQMVETAAKTPFNLTELATGAKQLVAYGFASEGVNDTLIRLGNIASGLGLPLERLTYLYGTTMTQGRLYARDLMQFTTSGIPMLQGLADMYGVSTDKVNEMVTAGKIGFPEVQKVIENLTNEGGKFFNLMEEQSKTITGKISNLGDAWDEMLNKIGQSQEGIINDSIDGLKYLVENYEKIGQEIFGLITAYGAYKSAIIVLSVVEKARYNATLAMGAAEKTLTTWQAIRFAATEKLTSAQKALNAVILKNPYVLIGMAVAGLAYGIYKLATAETEAERIQQRYNKAIEEQSRQLDELKSKTSSLVSIVKDENSTQYDKVKAYKQLQTLMPTIFSNMDIETLKLMDHLSLNKQINNEINRRERIGAQTNVILAQRKYDEAKGLYANTSSKHSEVLSRYAKMKQAEEELEVAKKVYSEIEKIQAEVNKPKELKIVSLQSNIDTLKAEISEIKSLVEKEQEENNGWSPNAWLLKAKRGQLSTKEKEMKSLQSSGSNKEAGVQNKSFWDTQKKDAETAIDAIDSKQRKLLNAGKFDKVDSKVVANYKEQKRLIAEAEKELKAYPSASDTTKQSNSSDTLRAQQEKYNLLMDKQTRDRVRAEEDAANEIRQAEIDADKDGAEKVLKQRKLNHDKEIQAIVREADDRKQAVIDAGRAAFEANPANKGKSFDEKKFVKSESANAEFLRINKTAQSKVDAENAKYNRGDDLSSLLDGYQDFADQRLAIEKKFNEDIKVLDDQRKTALENGNMEQVAKIDRSKVQAEKNKKEDLSGVSLEEFKADIDWATLFGNLDVLSPELLNKLRDKLKAFIETAADKLKPEDLKVLSEAITNVDLTIADKTPYEALKSGLSGYKVATNDAATAQEKLNKLQKDGKGGTQEYKDATKELTDAQRRRAESLKTVTQAANNIGSKGMEVVNAGNEIVGMLENFGVEVPEAVGKTLDGVGQVMSGLESIDLTKPFSAVTGAVSVLTGLGNTIAGVLGFGKENKSLKDTQRLEEVTSRIAETEKVINSFIEKRIDLLKAANIEEQKNLSATTKQAIENQKAYQEKLFNSLKGNWLLDKAGKNNNLTAEDLGISSIEDLVNFFDGSDLQDYLQNQDYGIRDADQWYQIIDAWKALQEKEKELADTNSEFFTGITLDDARNALGDFIIDADASFADVSDSFESYMRDAMLNIVKRSYLNKAMEDWYKNFEKAMSDGTLGNTEAGDLQKEYEDAYTGAQERYLAALKAAGISAESDSSREASQKGIATASQDSVDENNGRLTVMQGHTYSINESVTSIKGNTEKIAVSLSCLTNIDKNMSDMIRGTDIIVAHLSNIEGYTANLVEMRQFMYSMKLGIERMNDKGLKLQR